MAGTNNIKQIFISYSWNDSEKVKLIKSLLRNDSLNIISDEILKVGDDIPDFMKRIRAKHTDYALMFISDDYLKSLNAMNELSLAFYDEEYKGRIVPIIHDDISSIRSNRSENSYIRQKYRKYWEDLEASEIINQKELKTRTGGFEIAERIQRIQNIINQLDPFFNLITKSIVYSFSEFKDNGFTKILRMFDSDSIIVESDTLFAQGYIENESIQRELTESNIEKAGKLYLELGDLFYSTDRAESMFCYKKSSKLNSQNPVVWNSLGLLHYRFAEYDEALECFNEAMENNTGNESHLAITYNRMANVYESIGNLSKSEIIRNSSLKIYEKLNDIDGQAGCYNNFGLVKKTRGDLESAENYYNKALNLYKRNSIGYAMVSNNLGKIYRVQGKLDDAMDLHNLAFKIYKENDDEAGISYSYNYSGNVFLARGETDMARIRFRKALNIEKKQGNKKSISRSYGDIATLYFIDGNYNKSLELVNDAITIDTDIGWTKGLARQYCKRGQIYHAMKKFVDAVNNYNKSLKIWCGFENKLKIEMIEELIEKTNLEQK